MELLRAEDRDLEAESLERWGHDIMRHTFASNHLAYHEDLDKLTLQDGAHDDQDELRALPPCDLEGVSD